MKKILSGDENTKKWTMEATCTGKGWNQKGRLPCNALWELDQRDIKKRVYVDYGGGSNIYYGFVCPDCGCFTELNTEDLPREVMNCAQQYIEPCKEDEL